jgi:hypothetical protein
VYALELGFPKAFAAPARDRAIMITKPMFLFHEALPFWQDISEIGCTDFWISTY